MKVPFLDLDTQYDGIKTEILFAINSVLETKDFIQGTRCAGFATNFCEVHGGDQGVGCSNGTSALTVSLRALGVGAGDEVITAANTFFATVEAIAEVGAKIVLVDCCPVTYGMDIEKLEGSINKNTKAIIPVHMYGNPVPMDRVMEIANKYKLNVIEDCAQAHLSSFKGQSVGTFGDTGTFSFFPGKNLGAYGDAGLVLTNSKQLFQKVTMHVNHGRTKKYEHDFLAGNFRMDAIQAEILNVKLKYISGWTDSRINIAKKYDDTFQKAGFKVIKVGPDSKCVYHLYVVEVSNRDEVMSHLKNAEIATGIHYPVPMHLQPALSHLEYKQGDFPAAEKAANRIISLPIFPEMTEEQVQFVASEFLKVAKS